ncbi:(S)-limonene 3-monooxygenase [Handroanthus impetiginosus]|uniref:(S)-limonene 3-monooxygenase n=1 Tax=Handroanthus impetiginosus TaxID=429701 RepID=A0A2G9GFT2_9LAMI|nr:(S)-limonene 3-monooxygenase [Handroanthus impetiginosus]
MTALVKRPKVMNRASGNKKFGRQKRDFEYCEYSDEFFPKRICAGMFMGIANVELIVANLLHFFDWELPPGIQADDVDTNASRGLTVHKKNALFVIPKKYVV